MESELLIVLGVAWLGGNAAVGGLAMLGVRIHEGKSHSEAQVQAQPRPRTPVAETLRDALRGDGGAHPSA